MTLNELLEVYDSIYKKGFDEYELVTELNNVSNSRDEFELLCERMAFDFCEAYDNNRWGTYFGPSFEGPNKDGDYIESPSINKVTPEMISYWGKRANITSNPILSARYYGLIWDFHKKVCKVPPPYDIGYNYIKCLVAIANGDYHKHEVTVFEKLKRALFISINMNNEALISQTKNALINYEARVGKDDLPGLWGYCFDLLVGNRKVNLSPEEESKIISELENKLNRLSASDKSEDDIDLWAVESVAQRLATHYQKLNTKIDVERIIFKLGEVFDRKILSSTAMQSSGWLERLYKVYSRFGLKNEANLVLIRLRDIGPKLSAEMGEISIPFDIQADQMKQYVMAMTSGSTEEILTRIVIKYINSKEKTKDQLLNSSKQNAISYLFTKQLQDYKGRVVARILPLEDDLDGHIVNQMSTNMTISAIFLRSVLNHAINESLISSVDILNFISNTPVIENDRIKIIKIGIEQYFSGDYLSSIHLLIPQIEEAIRNTLEISGGNVLKQSKSGGFQLKTFDEILRDPLLEAIFGEDLPHYYRVLFTDPRGWNLRNNVCHGMAPSEIFNIQTADRIIHALLCLGLIKVNEDSD